MNRVITLAMVALLAASSLVLVGSVSAESIPKPSVPEFTVKYVDYSYDTPATYGTDPYTGKTIVTNPSNHVDNRTVQITIENQPFTTYMNENGIAINLFYNVRYKGSFGENWTMMFGEQAQWLGGTNPYLTYGYALQEPTSSKTTVILTLPWNIVSGQMDFQVEALIGYTNRSLEQGGIMYARWTYDFYGQESGWSSTQTINLSNGSVSPSSTPNPTVVLTTTPMPSSTVIPTTNSGNHYFLPQLGWEVVAVVALGLVAVLVVVVVVLGRRIRRLERKVE